ncbi:hypothetical protein F4823DRAFT_621046 [Ustulina deusta]|nr:hypothetical protein F4823DRAFT_621046 [Ustulina deusta]
MAHTRGNLLSLQLLASVAQDAYEIIFPLAIKNANGLVANIAIRLKFIAENLSNQELSKIPLDAQTVSTKALQDLLQIAKWPPPKASWGRRHIEEDPQALRHTLGHLLQNEASKRQVQQSVTTFCKERPSIIRPFESRFAHLSDLLTKNILRSQRTLTDAAAYSLPPPRDVYPDQVHKLFLDGVKSHAACMLEGHAGPGPQGTAKTNWHITRLCLESGFLSEDQRVLFKIVTTTSKMTYWQELAFRVPIINTKVKDAQESRQGNKDTFDTTEFSLISSGDACKYLDNPIYARISIELDEDCHLYQLQDPERLQYIISGHGLPLSELLKLGKLTVEQKIKLSYTVARAFWQFYNSELMSARWTSEDIFLFRLDQEFPSPEDILLRVFVSFPFGSQYKESPAEFYEEGLHTHRYPRVKSKLRQGVTSYTIQD